MPDETARVVPEQTPADNAAALEQVAHAAGCHMCAIVVHSLFATAFCGGSPGSRAGEMASIIGRGFCAAMHALDIAGDKASPNELAYAADVAIDAYLAPHGAYVPDHARFRLAIASTIAAALGAAGDVRIASGPEETRH